MHFRFTPMTVVKTLTLGAGALLAALSLSAQAVVFQAESYTYFYDTTPGNTGGAYRSDDVDIENAQDTNGGYNIGWIETGEWLAYTNLTIPTTGSYIVKLRVASPSGATASVDLNAGAIQLGTFQIGATGGWQNWTTVSKTVTIDAGTYNLGVFAQTAGWNFNWIEITPAGGTNNPDCGSTWYRANLTHYESYPDPGSDECILYNGCTWAGQFYGLNGVQPESWVMANNIAAVHLKDWNWMGMKTINLRQGSRRITAMVYDGCSDSDCDGCCTANLAGDGYLIDLEKYTMQRFGSGSGIVEFQVCN